MTAAVGNPCWRGNACPEFLKGNCSYEHPQEPVKCREWEANGTCGAGTKCMHMHIATTGVEDCKYFLHNFCVNGDSCRCATALLTLGFRTT